MNSKKLLVIILIILPTFCFADTELGSIFDDLVHVFASSSHQWMPPMQKMAIQIFSILFIPETCWLMLKKQLEGNIQSAIVTLVIRLITGGFYFYWITHPEIFFGIINYFAQAGSNASGFKITPNGEFSLMPSQIMNYFGSVTQGMSGQMDSISGIRDGITVVVSSLYILIILFCLVLISLMLTVTEIESYVVCSGGIGLTGFAGSSWTMSYFQSYLRFVVAVGVKMMFTCLIVGLLSNHLTRFSLQMSACASANVCSLTKFYHELVIGVIDCIVITYLSYHVPNLVSSLLSGNLNMNYSGLMTAGAAVTSVLTAPAKFAPEAVKSASNVVGAAASIGKAASAILGKSGDNNTPGSTGGGIEGGTPSTKFSTAMDHLKDAGSKLGKATGHAGNAFGQLASSAQKVMPSGGRADSGRGPDIR